MLDESVADSERTIKGLAKRCEVPRQKLLAMRRGLHGIDLAVVLGLPEQMRDAFLDRCASLVGREWVRAVEPESGEGWDEMIAKLRDAFEEAMRELRTVSREGRMSPALARRVLRPVRTARRLLTGIEVLAERALEESDSEREEED